MQERGHPRTIALARELSSFSMFSSMTSVSVHRRAGAFCMLVRTPLESL